jgi:zinc transporter ZupT
MIAALLGLEGEAITACAAENQGGVGMYFGAYNLVVKGCNGIAIAIVGMLAAQATGEMGPFYVKLMGVSAGGMLILGLAGYWVLKPRTSI